MKITILSVLLTLTITSAAIAESAPMRRPNILFILSDDHSYPHLGCYGNSNIKRCNITPNFDAFANQGMRFDRAYTTAPQCAPSRTSIFTGRSAVGIGVAVSTSSAGVVETTSVLSEETA